MITSARTGGRAATGSGAHLPLGAGWGALLNYLRAAGLCDRQLEDVHSLLGEIRFQDIDITISRMGGEPLEWTISCYLTVACLKKRLARAWTLQASSLQLAIETRLLDDSDVVSEFLTSTHRVVHVVVVHAPRLPGDRCGFTEFNDEVNLHLENVAPYMDAGQHRHLVMLWEQSCQFARESGEAAACLLSRLSNPVFGRYMFDRAVKGLVRGARKVVRDAIVYKVQAWHLVNIRDFREMVPVFESLAEYASCPTDTVSQLLNGARRMSTEQLARHVHWPVGAWVDLMNVNTLAPIVNGGGCISPARREPRVSATIGTCVALDVLNASGLPVKPLCEQRVSEDFLDQMD